MKYLFVYYSSGKKLSEEEMLKNRGSWLRWNKQLNEVYGIKVAIGGKTVSSEKIEDYDGDIKGVSIIEASSMDEAIEKAKNSPSVQFGGRVEVFKEF